MSDCKARFRYFQWSPLFEDEKPYEILLDIPKEFVDQPRSNMSFEYSKNDQIVRSVRNKEFKFDLDKQGFAFHFHPIKNINWRDVEQVKKYYIPEIEHLIREKVQSADRVFVYDWRLRNSSRVFPETLNLKDPTEELHPATQPHVDCSLQGCKLLLEYHLPEEAEKLWKKRVRIVNVWRPLHTVKNWPLALCDGRTIDDKDLISADRIRREFVAEGLWALENLRHEWYYWPHQTVDEVILLKIADTLEDVATRNCVHASFNLGQNVSRESIEARVFIFSD